MCTIIVTIRSVLWSVMTIAATLMILVALFTDRWIIGGFNVPSSLGEMEQTFSLVAEKGNQFLAGRAVDKDVSLGIFIDCVKPNGNLLFYGECIPNLDKLEQQMTSDNDEYPHAWKGGVVCFAVGLLIMVTTVVLSLLTPCLRHCVCCSIFTLGGTLQASSAVLFTLGLFSHTLGWGSKDVRFVCGDSQPFQAGDCQIGQAYWLAASGTLCTYIATGLTMLAHKSTRSGKAAYMLEDGDRLICVA